MVDNLRPLRIGEEKRKKKVETTAAEYNGLPVGGHNKSARLARRGVIGAGNSE